MSAVRKRDVIYLIVGTNAYRADEALRAIVAQNTSEPERYSGETMTLEDLADIATGQSLFARERFVVVRGLSANKPVWEKVGDWAERFGSDVTLVFLEDAPDKRTKGYKALAKHARVIEAAEWTDRQTSEAREWVRSFVKRRGGTMTMDQEKELVDRAMTLTDAGKQVISQAVLHTALEVIVQKNEAVTSEAIDAVLPPSTAANVFSLLEHAVGNDSAAVQRSLGRLRHTEDPYKVMGLLASQWAQVVAVTFADKPASAVASELGISPFALKSADRLAAKMPGTDVERYTILLADMEFQTKSVTFDPWLAVERFLLQLAARG